MILFVILLLTLIMLTIFTVLALSAGATVFIVLFGDIIVCAVFIVWIMKNIIKRKKK